MTNSDKLKKWLNDRHYKLSWLENKLMVSKWSVSMWTNGHGIPKRTHRDAIEEITGGAVPADGWAR